MCWFLAFQPRLHPHKRKGEKKKDKEKRINRSRIFSIWNKTEKLVTTSIRPNKCFTVPLQARNSQRFVCPPASRTEWPHHWCQAYTPKKKKKDGEDRLFCRLTLCRTNRLSVIVKSSAWHRTPQSCLQGLTNGIQTDRCCRVIISLLLGSGSDVSPGQFMMAGL